MGSSSVTGYYRHGSRYYVYDEKYKIRIGYWNEWLGLSEDLEEALDNYTKKIYGRFSLFSFKLLVYTIDPLKNH